MIKKYLLYLNTQTRTSGTASDAVWNLQQVLALTKKNSKFYVRLISAVIPYSFSQINKTNQVMTGYLNATPFTITIPTGTYNIYNLLLQLASELLLIVGGSTIFEFLYNPSTNLVSLNILSSNISPLLITLNYNPILLMLGFTAPTTFGLSSISISNQNVNVAPSQKLFIRSSSFGQSQSYEAVIGLSNFSDIIADIPIQTGTQSYINFFEPNNYYVPITNKVIPTINLYITDSQNDNEIIDLVLNTIYTLEIVEYHQPEFKENEIHDIHGVQEITPENKDINELITRRNELINDLKKKKYQLQN